MSIIILLVVLVTGVMRLFRQPLLIGYIITGVIVSPHVLDIITSKESIATFAHIGIAILLFMIGLNLNPKIIREIGKVSLITGVGQVVFTSAIGFGIGWLLGFSVIEAAYIAIALTFSSTIIILKLLSDKKDTDTLYGKIAIGFLIVQDVIAIVILMFISAIQTEKSLTALAMETTLVGAGLLLALYLISEFILPQVTPAIAKSNEFLMLFSIGWCFAIAALFSYMNFSIEAGALLAGIALSFTPYHYEISSKMKPLRDFFIILFFITLGSQMAFSDIGSYIIPIVIFSVFILVGNPLIVMVLMGVLKYTRRNSFRAGLTVAQISEFSLIMIAMGVSAGHLTNDILSMVTMVGLMTIAGSSYMIIYSNGVYSRLSRFLKVFEVKGRKIDEHRYRKSSRYDTILFGYNRTGHDILSSLRKSRKRFLVIDYNPEVVKRLAKQGIDCIYGDATDLELLEELGLKDVRLVISTMPHLDSNILLIRKMKQARERSIIAVVSYDINDAITLYDAGATYVFMPHFLGGKHMGTMIEEYGFDVQKFIDQRIMHLNHLKQETGQPTAVPAGN